MKSNFLKQVFIVFAYYIQIMVTEQISQWYGYTNIKSTIIGEFGAPNNGYIINKICIANNSIIDTIGNITFTNEYNSYTDLNMYGDDRNITSCFISTSCINKVIIGLGQFNSYDVIAQLIFESDNNVQKSFGGNNPNNPPIGFYHFNCDPNYCLSKIRTKYNPYIHAIQFECGTMKTMQPTYIPTGLPSTLISTMKPTLKPTVKPTMKPKIQPTIHPTFALSTMNPTIEPTVITLSSTNTSTKTPTISPNEFTIDVIILNNTHSLSLHKITLIVFIGGPGWICCIIILVYIACKKYYKKKSNNKSNNKPKTPSVGSNMHQHIELDADSRTSTIDNNIGIIINDNDNIEGSSSNTIRRGTNVNEEGQSQSIDIELPSQPRIDCIYEYKYEYSDNDFNINPIESDSQICKLEALNEFDKRKHTLSSNNTINDQIISQNLCMNIADMYMLTKGINLPPTKK